LEVLQHPLYSGGAGGKMKIILVTTHHLLSYLHTRYKNIKELLVRERFGASQENRTWESSSTSQ